MSLTPCNNKVQLGDYLSSDDLSKVYVREGPAGGISNTYTKSGGSFQSVDAADQGNCLSLRSVDISKIPPISIYRYRIGTLDIGF